MENLFMVHSFYMLIPCPFLWESIWYQPKNNYSFYISIRNFYPNIFRYNIINCNHSICWSIHIKSHIYSYFYFLNALGWLVSAVAIKKGYVNELSKSRTVTLALLVGIIIGYILGNVIPLDK